MSETTESVSAPASHGVSTRVAEAGKLVTKGQLDRALQLLETEEVALCGRDDRAGRADVVLRMGTILDRKGKQGPALGKYLEAEKVAREAGDVRVLQAALGAHASMLMRGEKGTNIASAGPGLAARMLAERLKICRRIEEPVALQDCLGQIAALVWRRDPARARELLEQQERICRDVGELGGLQACLAHQAAMSRVAGDEEHALRNQIHVGIEGLLDAHELSRNDIQPEQVDLAFGLLGDRDPGIEIRFDQEDDHAILARIKHRLPLLPAYHLFFDEQSIKYEGFLDVLRRVLISVRACLGGRGPGSQR